MPVFMQKNNEEVQEDTFKMISTNEMYNNMLGVNENYLLIVFNIIDSKYKRVEDCLLEEFGLTKEKINKISAYCLI